MSSSSLSTPPPLDPIEYSALQPDDVRVIGYDPLISPALLSAEIPLSHISARTVALARSHAADIVAGRDDRLIVIVGPCSIHSVEAALDYAARLAKLAGNLAPELLIIMRTYFEKPRTTVGWKGLINDPFLDGSNKINEGLRIGRKLLCQVTELGLPVAVELLDTISPQFLGDLISWGAIGARTTESQLHRELASGCSFPVGFKNGTDGSVEVAFDAVKAASCPHHFLGVTKNGLAAITKTKGNQHCHVILRGGRKGPNFDKESVLAVMEIGKKKKAVEKLMIDVSHGNSRKDYRNQPSALSEIGAYLPNFPNVIGVMVESHINAGRQDLNDPRDLAYGVSITDACVDWDTTVVMLQGLAESVQRRRATQAKTIPA